jgi:hypothetical protein
MRHAIIGTKLESKAQANKRVQSDAAVAVWYRGKNRLCDAARSEADLGKLAARLTRRALARLSSTQSYHE